MSTEIIYMTATELVARYGDGSLTPVEVTQAALDRLDQIEPKINAFQYVDHESALAAARASETRWQSGGPQGALDGVPVTVKDLIPLKGWPLRNGSATTDETPCDFDAPSVARLREAGAVFLGKTTSPEYGWKGITDGPLFGYTRNPWKLAHSPGGSSGGAAASMAAGVGALALGNDGGGSIRIPSSYSGIYGIKPNFGRVPDHPREGAFCTTSAEGPMTRSVEDAALMLNAIAKPDARDWYALPYDDRDWRDGLDDGIKGWRIAYAPGLGGAKVDPEVRQLVDLAVARFGKLGAEVEEVGAVFEPLEPQFTDYWLAGFASILRGIPEAKHDLLDPRFRDLAERGLSVTLAQYNAAMVARARLGVTMKRFHETYDLLVTPTLPTTAPIAETPYHSQSLHRWNHAVPFTLPFNLTGQPGASVPCGLASNGLPVGLQLVAAPYREDLVLKASRAFEAEAPQLWPQPLVEEALGTGA